MAKRLTNMKRLMMGTAVAALMALCHPAQATVIVATNTVSFEGISGGVAQPSDFLFITYDVNETSPGVYEYDYDSYSLYVFDSYSFLICLPIHIHHCFTILTLFFSSLIVQDFNQKYRFSIHKECQKELEEEKGKNKTNKIYLKKKKLKAKEK